MADVAAMMAAAAGNPRALGQHYNACTDRAITLDGLAHMVADALGKRAEIVHYNVKVRSLCVTCVTCGGQLL